MSKHDEFTLAVGVLLFCLFIGLIGLIEVAAGQGRSRALPEEERTAEATRWLAVAFIAEAGWADPKHEKAEADHRGIYHVLRRRWLQAREQHPHRFPTFRHMVSRYVAAMDPRTPRGGRVRWLLSLRPGEDREPAGWPQTASWSKHRVWWKQAQTRAADCIAGKRCADPYPYAWHWGGPDIDSPRGCMIELANVGTFNTFYGIDRKCRRK